MISQKIAALLVLILFTFEAYGKTKNYSVDIFSRIKISQLFANDSEDSLIGGSFSYSQVNWNYNFSPQLMSQLSLDFTGRSTTQFIPIPKIKDVFLLYKFNRSANFQVGIFPAPLGYYYDNLKKFSFMETTFGTLNFKSLYLGGFNGSFFHDASFDFGALLNKKLNSRFSLQLAISFPNKSPRSFTIFVLRKKIEKSKNIFQSSKLSGVANLIYKAKPYEAFLTYSYRSNKNNKIYSAVENDDSSFLNTASNFLGVGGKTHFRAKANRKILVKVQGEAWLTNRGYARPAPDLDEEDLSVSKDFEPCWIFWDCLQENNQKNKAAFNSKNFNLNIVNAYIFPEVHWKRFKLGLLLGASSSSIGEKNQSFKESLNYEYILQGSYELTEKVSFVLEHFYQNNSNYPHKNLFHKNVFLEFNTNNTIVKGWAASLKTTISI